MKKAASRYWRAPLSFCLHEVLPILLHAAVDLINDLLRAQAFCIDDGCLGRCFRDALAYFG